MTFAGNSTDFISSGTMAGLVQSEQVDAEAPKEESQEEKVIEDLPSKVASSAASVNEDTSPNSETESTLAASSEADTKAVEKKKTPRKLIEEEKRAVGRIGREIWKTYFSAVGGTFYWILLVFSILLAAASPVAENGWLRYVRALTSMRKPT